MCIESYVHFHGKSFSSFYSHFGHMLVRALWAGMDNAKKALHDSESRSRSESLNDSGIYISP